MAVGFDACCRFGQHGTGAAAMTAFRKWCLPCHDAGDGAKIKLGPPLNGIDGRVAGTFAGFNYSDANKNSGITWNEATFKEYIKNPMQRMPGTRMAFAGVQDTKEVRTTCGPTSSSSTRTARRSRAVTVARHSPAAGLRLAEAASSAAA